MIMEAVKFSNSKSAGLVEGWTPRRTDAAVPIGGQYAVESRLLREEQCF